MGLLNGLGNAIQGAAQTAVKASPYAASILAQRKQAEERDRQTALAQLYALNQDNRANMAATQAYAQGAANLEHTNAQTEALRHPAQAVKYLPSADGTYQGLPTKVTQGSAVAPIETGIKAPPKPAPKIDPLSPQGVAASNAKTDHAVQTRAANAPPKNTPLVKTMKPDGSIVYTRQDQAAGMSPPTTTTGGGQSLAPEDRAKMLAQAKLDNETMKQYEAKVMAGKASVGTVSGVAGATADAHGGPLNNALGIIGNKVTGAIDPEYQRYLTAQRSYGRIMGNLQSKRYTDHQAEIERSISGLQGNDLHSTILYKQQLRDASLADPHGSRQANDPGGNIDLSAPAATPKKATKDYGIFGKPTGGDE